MFDLRVGLRSYPCLSGTGLRVGITNQQASELGIVFKPGIACGPSNSLYIVTDRGLVLYDPGCKRIEQILNGDYPDIADVECLSDGTVLVLRQGRLDAWAARYLIKLYEIPNGAVALSCNGDCAYLLLVHQDGGRLLRIELTGPKRGRIQTILVTEDRPSAICAVEGGCLVASGGNVFKVTDPSDSGEVLKVLLVAIQDPICSLAVDQDRLILYLAGRDAAYAWINGQVLPLFPAGGALALAGDTLTICTPGRTNGQLIQIPSVSQMAGRLSKP